MRLMVGLLVLAAALHWVFARHQGRRNYEFMPDMVESPAYGSQGTNPNFADGKTLQRPPEGTIAVGFLPLHVGDALLDVATPWDKLPDEQKRMWDGLAAPVAGEAALARGKKVFSQICVTCHGISGLGDGPATRRGVPPPPSLLGDGARAMSGGRLFRIITAGKGNMASHASQLERSDRWKVVLYVRELQGG